MNRFSAIAPALLLPLLLVTPAAGDYQPGDGFQVDGIYFHVVSVSPETGALFRAAARLPGHDAGEHPACYRVGRTFYYQEACPALQAHFARGGAPADGAARPATTTRASYGSGSHPIDYLRGSYVEPERHDAWAWTGLYYRPWSLARPGFDYRRGFGHRHGFGFGFGRALRPVPFRVDSGVGFRFHAW